MPPPLCKLGMRFDDIKGMCCAFHLGFGRKIGPHLSEDLFFCSSPNFGPKMGPNLSEDLYFYFALHLILGRKSDEISVEQFLIQIFVFPKFTEISGPPFSKSCVRYCPKRMQRLWEGGESFRVWYQPTVQSIDDNFGSPPLLSPDDFVLRSSNTITVTSGVI